MTKPKRIRLMGSASERFWPRVDVSTGDDGCWLWMGRLNERGYGLFSDDRQRTVRAHRWAWEAERGPIPAGLELDHLCHDPFACVLGDACPHRRCVNPRHLALVTKAENTLRRNPATLNRLKTHCKNGHPLDGAPVYRGQRICVTCKRAFTRKYNGSMPMTTTITCLDCGETTPRTGHYQRRCPACAKRVNYHRR